MTDDQRGRAAEAPLSADFKRRKIRFLTVGELMATHMNDKPEIVQGFLREQEIMNIIGAPKSGKSWFAMQLALSVVAGVPWLGKWRCATGRVLYVDNELHDETLACRFRDVADAMGISHAEIAMNLVTLPLRGELVDVKALESVLAGDVIPGDYDLMVLDAWYRFLPEAVDENSNSGVTRLYSHLQQLAKRFRSAIVIVHHTSKGPQKDRAITDRGAGAGSQSRSADTHLTFLPHTEAGVFTIEAVVRSMPNPSPFAVRREHPLMICADDIPALPARIRVKEPKPTMTHQEFAQRFASGADGTKRAEIIHAARDAGMTHREVTAALKDALAAGWLTKSRDSSRSPDIYRSANPSTSAH